MKEKSYNELAKYYDKLHYQIYQKQIDFLDRVINMNFKDKKIALLDLACGTGAHIKLLKHKYNIEGLDINKGMLKLAKRKNPENLIISGDLNHLNLKRNYYDLIYCLSGSIQYILSSNILERAFKKIWSSLRKNGLLIFDLQYPKSKWLDNHCGIKTYKEKNLQIVEIFKSRRIGHIGIHEPVYLISKNGRFQFFIDDHKIFLYEISQIKRILNLAKFKNIKVFGDYTLRKYYNSKNRVPVFISQKG